ncbi:hypothetical protein [Paramagnetospirillum magneticum]|nr:hypothetical protein [Paramagnetospirillum magneticum]
MNIADAHAQLKRAIQLYNDLGGCFHAAPPWTSAEENTIREAYAAGLSLPEIARLLARSQAAVKLRAHYLGLRRPAARSGWESRADDAMSRLWSAFDDDTLRDLWTAGVQVDDIATALNRSAAACRLRASQIGAARPEGFYGAAAHRRAAE